MFILNDTIFESNDPGHSLPSGGHRFYRSRNVLNQKASPWRTFPEIPDDVPFWDDMFGISARAGLKAAKQTLKPAMFVWATMAGVALLYYLVPASQNFFTALTKLQTQMGLLFPFFGMGLSVGLIAEIVKVSTSKEKRWTRENTTNAGFNLLIFGTLGVFQNYFYQLQTSFFGTGTSWQVLVPKVLLDQFVWTVFFANPYQTILYVWKNHGYSFKKVASQMQPFKAFWGTQILPVLITNWAFWIPMVSIIYCFPANLQLPLAILAVTIWVLLLTILTSQKS